MLEAIQATIYKQILSNRPIELKKNATDNLNPGPEVCFFNLKLNFLLVAFFYLFYPKEI